VTRSPAGIGETGGACVMESLMSIIPTRRHFVRGGAAMLAGCALLRARAAEAAYPDRPIKIVVANTPGGPSDIIARFMAAAMQGTMGASVIVENKGGAGGNIGMGMVARAEPDGYTILLATSAYSVNPGLYLTLPYEPFKDFVAICELAVSPNVFAVSPNLPASNMKEFVALAKANPEKFNVSVPPIGTTPQLQAELLKVRDGLKGMASVVFAGGGDALKALMGGTVQLSSGVLAPAHPHLKAGAIRGLAVTGRTRWHDLQEIPTMLESGYPDFVFETYTALMAPAKTPPEIVSRLENSALEILRTPEMRDKLTQAGFEVTAKSGKEHMKRVAKEVPMFAEIIAQAGINKL
jgi:tripartite-type tricarboxylate transporter receptor subunit TctC